MGLLELNRMVNSFQNEYEGRKISIFENPEFRQKWADILERQSRQPNGRKLFMTVYFHPILGHVRVAKWLPKRNVCMGDQGFLIMTADDLRCTNDVFAIESGQYQGYYRKVSDFEPDMKDTIILNASTFNDSGVDGVTNNKNGGSDPEFVEITDEFTDSETEYEALMKKNSSLVKTSTKDDNGQQKPSLDESDILSNELEKSKLQSYSHHPLVELYSHESIGGPKKGRVGFILWYYLYEAFDSVSASYP